MMLAKRSSTCMYSSGRAAAAVAPVTMRAAAAPFAATAAAAAASGVRSRSRIQQQHQQKQRRCRAAAVVAEAAPPAMDEDAIRDARAAVTRRIKALGAQRKLKEAVQELASLSTLGVTPDARAATALVAACAQAGNMDMAEAAFEQLFGREGGLLEPDEVAFAVLVRGYGALRPGPQWGGIDATLTRMRSRYGLEPTAVAYNALLEVCVAADDADRALDVIDRMADDGVEPDALTLAAVARKRSLRAYLKKRLA